MSSSNPSCVTFLTVVTKCLTKQLKEDLFVLHSVVVGESRWGEERWLLTLNPVRKQREVDAGVQLVFPFLEVQDPSPKPGVTHIQAGSSLLQ